MTPSLSSAEMPVPDYLRDCWSLRCLVSQYWDLSAVPRPRTFALLAQNCKNELEREKLLEFATAQDQDALFKYANRPRRTTLELLKDFPQATSQLQLETLMELFSVIRPRSFSIASSSKSGRLDLLVAVVEYKTILSEARLGLCSNWLKGLQPGSVVYAWLKKGTMRLPMDATDHDRKVPLVMVGPGTGLAPFRSILQEKQLSGGGSAVKDILLFGCRNEDKDFHCRAELEKWHKQMTILLITAFSRDQDDKCYVQHRICTHAETIKKALLADKGTVLVAGSSKDMPKAVRQAITEAIGDEEYVQHMVKVGRYQEETWS